MLESAPSPVLATNEVRALPDPGRPLPQGWSRMRLDDAADRASGHTPDQAKPEYWNGGIRWVSLADSNRLDSGYLFETDKEISALGIRHSSAVLLPAETVVLSRDAGIGKSAVLASEMAVSQHFIAWKCEKKGHLDPWFLYAWLQLNKAFFERMAVGSTIKTIGLPLFRRLTIDLPPLPEQRRIAEILQAWDEAIEKLKALGAAKERRLQTLRENLTYLESQGEPVRLGEVTEEVTARNGAGRLGREMVMGVTNSRGIVPMREQTIAEDIARYKLVPHKAFAYNPMRINVGSIAMNESTETILVSPDYVVFACVAEQLEPDFLNHLRKTKWWAHFIDSGGSGSVRQRTYYADLAAMKAPLPSFAHQRKIADILNTARRDVDTTAREVTALQRQKRGLMQKLLTGEWRTSTERNEA